MSCTVYAMYYTSLVWLGTLTYIEGNMKDINVHAIAFVVYSMSDLNLLLNVLQVPIADCASWPFSRNVPVPTLFLLLSVL